MKLFITTAVLCLTPFLSAAADDITLNGQTFRTKTVTPVAIDAYGRVRALPPLTILVRVSTEPVQNNDEVPLPRPTARSLQVRQHEQLAATRFQFANDSSSIDAPTVASPSRSADRTTPSTNDRTVASTAEHRADQRTAAYRDSRLFERTVY